MTEVWTFLGIEPTTDKRVIKRAYAKLLKQHKPDQDPQGFKQLREAYEQAVFYADNEHLFIDTDEEETDTSDIARVNLADENIEEMFFSPEPEQNLPEDSITYTFNNTQDIENIATVELETLVSSIKNTIIDALSKQETHIPSALQTKIEQVDIQTKRHLSFETFKLLISLTSPKRSDLPTFEYKHIVRITKSCDEIFHWQHDPLLESYFSEKSIKSIFPIYFKQRAKEQQAMAFAPQHLKSDVDAEDMDKWMWPRGIARRIIDSVAIYLISLLIAVIIGSENIALLQQTPVLLVGGVISITYIYCITMTYRNQGTIGAVISNTQLVTQALNPPTLKQICIHFLPIFVFILTPLFQLKVFICAIIFLVISHFTSLPYVSYKRLDAHNK